MKINNYPNYTIDEDGNIFSLNGKIKLPSKDKKGYIHITLSNNGIRKTFLVHRLVAEHFIDNPNNLLQVNHIDGDKSNNNVTNLEWVTPSDNIIHSFNNGLSNYSGENNGKSKLTLLEVIEIKKLINNKIKLKDIAKQFNVHPNTISEIKRGIKWKHVNL